MPLLKPEWLQTNRAHWDEAVGLHLAAGYDLTALRAGRGRLFPIEEAELGQSMAYAFCICNAISAKTR